jgi:hypothetical protein
MSEFYSNTNLRNSYVTFCLDTKSNQKNQGLQIFLDLAAFQGTVAPFETRLRLKFFLTKKNQKVKASDFSGNCCSVKDRVTTRLRLKQ